MIYRAMSRVMLLRCHLQMVRNQRGIRVWRKALPYPPNRGEHHFRLPSLEAQLELDAAERDPVRFVNVGLTDQEISGRFMDPTSLSNKVADKVLKGKEKRVKETIDLKQVEDLASFLKEKTKASNFSYDDYTFRWEKSTEGMNEVKNLALHQHIYRDLFSDFSLYNEGKEEHGIGGPPIKLIRFKPMPDKLDPGFIEDWFPGAEKDTRPPRDVHIFAPCVTVTSQFVLNDSKSKEPVVSPVFRGNFIDPMYATEKPQVVIDARTSAIDGSSLSIIGDEVKILTDKEDKHLYTIGLFCLDSLLGDAPAVIHWGHSNISSSSKGKEMVSFLPPYGVRGLGFHRYVFLVIQHDKELAVDSITDFDLKKRTLNPLKWIESVDGKGVGLSWFQSSYDDSCNNLFHNQLKMRVPVYEYIQQAEEPYEQSRHPFCAPFNHYLDHYRDPKEISASVLLERLAKVDPFDYSKQFEIDPLPNAYGDIRDIEPSWLQSTEWKRRNRLGAFRNLRPASATLPLNNNADLDAPIWPHIDKLNLPIPYPKSMRNPIPLRFTKWVLAPQDHPQYRIEHEDIHKTNEEQDGVKPSVPKQKKTKEKTK